MSHSGIITETQLDEWVRGHSRDAQGVIVELLCRLVAASSPTPKERRFPLGDSIGQPGPDGYLDTDFAFPPFVKEGKSFWEIGTGNDAGTKATDDYRDLTKTTPEDVRRESTFVFVTPLSGRRDWPYTWKGNSQLSWLKDRRERHEWRDVHAIDGTRLIDWLRYWPAVEIWMAKMMGLPAQAIQTLEQRWGELKTIGDPPPLVPDVFLANREGACQKLKEVFSRTTLQLQLDTHFPGQVADFVAAYVATMDDDSRVDSFGRTLIISDPEAWNAVINLAQAHILIADFDLDDSSGTRLLEKARRGGHGVVFRGPPGGVPPHPNRVLLPNPKSYQVESALKKAGYKDERARTLAHKSNGYLSSLLRCLQNLSLMPEWAQGTDAAELAIAELLGGWKEASEADKLIAEKLSGKAYGEWIGAMRRIALQPGTPLRHRDGEWKLVSRYEGWYALGPSLFDEHLDRVKEAAVAVLRELDPKFELAPEERYLANVHGKILSHSHLLRQGLAETLAILGSYPRGLTSCSFRRAEATAILAVREIFAEADWVLWASLDDLLPLLAEGAPAQFLGAVETALANSPCPFDTIFAQESTAFGGSNYLTGLLWALETLAWEPDYLMRVVVILGELAARDPGGNWSNRPSNSLWTILLPWCPQTCAPMAKRQASLATLLNEQPKVGWKLLLDLLPGSHQVSDGTRKPAWRELIPEDWSSGVTPREYWDDVSAYSTLAFSAAKDDAGKLADLVDRFGDLPPATRDEFISWLGSQTVATLDDAQRLKLWTQLVDLVAKHRRFADAKWALPPALVDQINNVANRLAPDAPLYRHQRLFSERDFDLFEYDGDYEKLHRELERRRQEALDQVFGEGGIGAVLSFAQAVESAWRVGIAFGAMAENRLDEHVLPRLLESQKPSLAKFAGGFVLAKFWNQKWEWVDQIDMSKWSPSEKGQVLAYLPFVQENWDRAAKLLGDDQSAFWSKTSANPYEANENLHIAVDRLMEYGRPNAAIKCLDVMLHKNHRVNHQQAVLVLKALLQSSEPNRMETQAILNVIKALQEDADSNPSDLLSIEWAYLPLLDREPAPSSKLLQKNLACDPEFFCQLIRTVFPSEKDERPAHERTEQERYMARNAYRLFWGWRRPPGTTDDGVFDPKAFVVWLENVKKSCAESGHLGIALAKVGHVLVYSPADPDGLWLHHAVAAALNAKDAEDMRDGFVTEFFNSRGGYWWSAGKEEKELAEIYARQAETLESHGYHRLANSLRQLVSSYEYHAEREASRDPNDD